MRDRDLRVASRGSVISASPEAEVAGFEPASPVNVQVRTLPIPTVGARDHSKSVDDPSGGVDEGEVQRHLNPGT